MTRRIITAVPATLALVWALVALAQVSSGGLSVKGPLPPAEAKKVMQAKLGAFNACVASRRRAGAAIAGTLVLEWAVNADGKVIRFATPSGSSITDAGFVACVSKELQPATFAKSTGESVITYTLVVAPPPSASRDEESKTEGDKRPAESPVVAQAAPASEPPPADIKPGKSAPESSASTSTTREIGGGRAGSGTRGTAAGGGSGSGYGGSVRAKKDRDASGGYTPARPTTDSAKPAPRAAEDRYEPSAPVATAPSMKAGRYDDNKQYNRFLVFLEENRGLIPQKLDVSERVLIKTVDEDGKSLHNCKVEVSVVQGAKLRASTTYADGSTHFFPSDAAKVGMNDFTVAATCGGVTKSGTFNRDGKREQDLIFDFARTVPASVPVDVAIVLDTTGSMGGQIDRLRQTLRLIHLQLVELPIKPDLRFALVAYRDRGDDYVTQVTPFTKDVKAFQGVLDKLSADGGGDTPEDLQEALQVAMKKLDWRSTAVRLGFVIADAIPHTDYGQAYDYKTAMRESLERGIKWSMVGAGGLPLNGEVIFRQIAQYTMGEYVFVTQGAQGDSEGGVGEASHHVGTNYAVENLDQAIVRIVRRELSHLTDTPRDFDYTIVASGTKTTPRDKVLAPAVAEVLRQLTDYCAIRLAPKTPVAVLPVDNADKTHESVAEYLSEQMILTASRKGEFKVVERDLRAVAQEQKLQLSDLFEAKKSVEFGKLIGAELLVVSRLTVRADAGELYAKLIRVETGEILSAAKVEFKGGVLAGS
jgi:TolB-like protein/Mg-chelatase subunit ChlD